MTREYKSGSGEKELVRVGNKAIGAPDIGHIITTFDEDKFLRDISVADILEVNLESLANHITECLNRIEQEGGIDPDTLVQAMELINITLRRLAAEEDENKKNSIKVGEPTVWERIVAFLPGEAGAQIRQRQRKDRETKRKAAYSSEMAGKIANLRAKVAEAVESSLHNKLLLSNEQYGELDNELNLLSADRNTAKKYLEMMYAFSNDEEVYKEFSGKEFTNIEKAHARTNLENQADTIFGFYSSHNCQPRVIRKVDGYNTRAENLLPCLSGLKSLYDNLEGKIKTIEGKMKAIRDGEKRRLYSTNIED